MNTNTGRANISGQEAIMLRYLESHKSVTRATAMSKLRIANSPEIIRRLKCKGYKILSEWCDRVSDDGERKRYKRYWLAPGEVTDGQAV